MVRLFLHDLEKMRTELNELRENQESGKSANTVKFTTKAKNSVQLERLHDASTTEQRYINAVHLLEANNIETSQKNLKKLGIGSSTISKFRKNKPVPKRVEAIKKDDAEVKKDGESLGYKVIVEPMPDKLDRGDFPEGSAGTKKFKTATKVANNQRTKRNRTIAKFGATNVTTKEECEANKGHWIKKRQKVKGVVRDVCV
jgi:hypothetical protein